jgi:hypothetical protein
MRLDSRFSRFLGIPLRRDDGNDGKREQKFMNNAG